VKKVLAIGKVFTDDLGVRTRRTTEVISDGFLWPFWVATPEDLDEEEEV